MPDKKISLGLENNKPEKKISLGLPDNQTNEFEGASIGDRYLDSQYDKGTHLSTDIDVHRAEQQPWQAQLGNALGRTALNIVPSTISQLAMTFDVEDWHNTDNEFGNAVSRAMETLKQDIGEELPIYRRNPGKALDLGDSGFWYDNGGHLLESSGSFLLTGGVIAKGLQMLPRLAQIGALARNVSPEKLEALTKAGQTLVSAFGLNQSEGGLAGMQVYDNVYETSLKEGLTNEEARQKAADAAAYTVNINRANILLNLTSSAAFLRSPKMSRGLLESVNNTKKVAGEAIQEGLEESINLVAEQEGTRKGLEQNYEYDFDKTIGDIFSKEGAESFLLGAVGGAVQTGGQSIMNRSQDAEQEQRVQAQQNYYTQLNEAIKSTGTKDLFSFLQSAKDQTILQKKIDTSDLAGTTELSNNLRNQLGQIQAFHAFENSSADKLEDMYKEISKLTSDEAAKKGLDINPTSKEYYKIKSQEAITKIQELEKTYNKLATRVPKESLKDAYINNLQSDKLRNDINDLDIEIAKERQKSNQEILAGLDLTETSNYKYLGELTSKKEDTIKQLRNNNLEFKSIVSGELKQPATKVTTSAESVVEAPISRSEDDKQLIKNFESTIFETEEDIQKAIYNLPENIRSDKRIQNAIKGKEQNIAYKQFFNEEPKVEVNKQGNKVQAIVIPEMYRVANNLAKSHLIISDKGTVELFNPDIKKNKKEPIKPVVTNTVPNEVPDVLDIVVEEIDPTIPITEAQDLFPIEESKLPTDDILDVDIESIIPPTEIVNKLNKQKTKAKEEIKAVKEIKNTEKLIQATTTKENSEINNPIVQAIGYDYARLNNPNHLNNDVRLSLEYITYVEGKEAIPTVIVEERDGDKWIKVSKLAKNYTGIDTELIKYYQNQFDSIVDYIKESGPVMTKVLNKLSIQYLNTKGVQSGLDQLLTNDRAKSNLPDGELYIGTIRNGEAVIRTIENNGQGGSVAIGSKPLEGRHFVAIKVPNGTIVPAYLQDTPIKDITINNKPLISTIQERIETIKNEFLQSELPKTQTDLNKFWNKKKKELIDPIVGVDRNDFKIGITLNKDNSISIYESKSKGQLTEDQVFEKIAERFHNIDSEQLKDSKYVNFLVKNRILTTDLDTERPVIDTKLEVDVTFLQHERLTATEPETVSIEETKENSKESDVDEELRKLEEELNPTVDPSKINDTKTRLVENRDYKQINIEQELNWIKTNLPQIPVNVVQSTVDIAKKFGVEAHGVFSNAMIYIAENGAVGTGYHEAYHAVETLYLTPEQVAKLNATGTTEEQRADQFAEYVQTEENISPKIKVIRDFFRDIYYWIKDVIGLTSTSDLFYKINTGKFANSPIQNSQFKSENKYKLIDPNTINPLEQKQRVESLLYQVFNGLRAKQNKGSIISLTASDIKPEDYTSVWNNIKRMWELQEVKNPHPNRKKVLDNWEEFKEETTKELKRFGIKAVEKSEELAEGEDTKERIYDVAYFKSDIKDTLSTEMKLFVATIPQIEKATDERVDLELSGQQYRYKRDELGNIFFVDRHEMYSNLSKELSNIISMEEMINKINYLGKANPQWYYIADFLNKTTSIVEAQGVTSNNFRNKFYSNFRNWYIKFLTIKRQTEEVEEFDGPDVETKKKSGISIFETNKRGLEKVILNRWKQLNATIEAFDIYTPFVREVNKIANQLNDRNNDTSLEMVSEFLNAIGVDMTKESLSLHKEEYFRKNYIGNELVSGRRSYADYLKLKNNPTVGQILSVFSTGKDIFGGGDNIGERKALELLADYQKKVTTDRTNGGFLNGEGDLVHPINSPTYASNRVLELKQDPKLVQSLLKDAYYRNSKLFNDLVTDPDFRNEFDLFVFDTINDSTTKKQSNISYSESQDFDYLVSKINAFYNNSRSSKYGFFFPPTPSDRGQITPIKLPKLKLANDPLFIGNKLNVDSEFTKWLLGSVEDEFNRIKQTWDLEDQIVDADKIKNYHYKGSKKGNAYYFNQFWNLNSLIYEDVNNPELVISSFDEINQTELLEILSKTFNTLIQNEKTKMIEKGILKKDTTFVDGILDYKIKSEDKQDFLNEYIVNQFYANFELSRLLSGDMAFYKGGPLSLEDRRSQFADFDKRFGQSFVPGRELGYSTEYSDVVKQQLRIQVANDIELANETLAKISKKYLKNNQTDAQGFSSLERMREIKIGNGTFTEKYRKAYDRVLKGETDASDITTVFQPEKGFYYSQDVNKYGIVVPTQVKYSVVPLIPALVNQFPDLKKIADEMEKNQVDEYVFESGIKVGRTKESILELKNKNWRIPQVVPYKDSTEERYGSQKGKLITENTDPTDEFEGKNLKDYYQELRSTNLKEDFKVLLPELNDLDNVAKTLLEQLVNNNSKGLPDKFIKALEVIDTKFGKDTRMSLDNPLIKKRVESIFNSLIDSRVVDQKLPGLSAVQVSTFGQVNTVEDLKFVRIEDGKVKPAEVKMTPKYFLKSLKKQKVDVTLFLTNGRLDISKIPVELRKGTLHRIPTQGKNSMLPFEIVEFTPNEAGSLIYLPVEVTTQAGSDFDIDKVFIEMYNFEVVGDKIEKVKGDDTKKGRQNKIVDIHYNILTNPKYFDELVTPNNTDTLSKIKDEILALQGSDNLDEYWFSPWVQEEFKSRNQAGKQLVALYSLVSTAHSVAQDIEMKLKDGYSVNFEGKELTELNKIKDISGTRISDNIGEAQTAAVDNAKEPILGYLNDNLFTAPVKALLIRAGVPLRQTNYFATQPILMDFSKAFFKHAPSMSDTKAIDLALVDVTSTNKYKVGKINKYIDSPANFTLQTLKDGLEGKGDPQAILEAFLYYKKIGDELSKVSSGINTDRKGTASTMSENLYNQKKITEAKNSDIITFNKELYNKHSLSAYEKYGIDEAVKLAKQYFSDGTKVFTTVQDRLADIKGSSLTVDELQDITYQFYTYLHTNSALKMSNEEKLALFTGRTSVVTKLESYFNSTEKNLFLDQLNIIRDEDTGFDFIDFNATVNTNLSAEEKQIFEDSILDLYRAGGAKKTFAIDLLKYCFATNGFNRGVNTFIDFIPLEMFEDLGLNEYYRNIKQNFDSIENNEFNLDRFVDQYIQNNFDKLYWVSQYSNKNAKMSLALNIPIYYYNKTGKKLYKYNGPTDITDYIVTQADYKELNKLGYKKLIKEYDLNYDLFSIIPTNNKSGKKQLDSEQQQITENQLVNTLDKLSARFGISYEIDYNLTSLGRYKNGKIYINPKLAKADTPFHEFAHPFVETIKKNNPVLYKNLERQLTTTSDGRQILNKVRRLYPDLSTEEQIEEGIVTAIGQYASKSITDRGLIEVIKVLLKRIASYIRQIVANDKAIVADELNPNMSLEDLGRLVSGEQKIITSTDIKSSKDQRDINEAEGIISSAIQLLQKKIKIYEKKGANKNFLDRELKIKNDLQKKLDDKQYEQGVVAFTANVRKELDLVNTRMESIDDTTSIRDKAEILKSAHSYAKSYQGIVKMISSDMKHIEEISDVIKGINSDIIDIETKYSKEIKPLFARFISQFVSNDKVNVLDELTNPAKDISTSQRWLDALSESSDNVIKWIDKAVKTSKEKARLKALDNQKDLLHAKKELEASGIKDSKFMYETVDGKLTGNLVTEYNQGAYNKAVNEFFNSIKDKSEAEVKLIRRRWNKENTKVIETDSNGKPVKYGPSDKYKNKMYSTIQSTPAMKKFYDIVWEKKRHTDSLLSLDMQKKVEFLAPQIRKDLIERIKDTDENKVNVLLTGIKEEFVRNENDTQFGVTDETGKPVNFLPTYFTNRLDNTNDLSTDIVATLSSYNYMAEDFNEMNKIVHQLEIGKDIIKEREVDTGKVEKVDTGRVDESGKKIYKNIAITKPGNESNTYNRLTDYYNMIVYGQMKIDEGNIGNSNIDKAKTIDAFGRYISINSLALNVFSGISNITYGTAMGRIEGFAKEHFNHKDLLFADTTYTKELPKVLGNIGQRVTDSKLDLWNEYMNVSQDFDENTRELDSERKTIFGRLFKTNSLFFISKAGEHYMQTRTSLALANRTMVKHNDGTETNLYDALEVKNGKLVAKEGYNVSEEIITKFILKQNGINKRLHGVYNNIDKSAIQKYALGRAAIMFRKWIKPGFNKRFENLKYNEELEMNTEGYYNTAWRFLGQLKRDITAGQFSLQKNWNGLSETEKRNMFRVFAEAGYMVAAATLAGVLTNLADDDDENWVLSMAAYQANRMYTELRFYSSATEAFTILKSPAAGINAAQNLVDFIWIPAWFDTIEHGKNSGMTKFERNLIKVTPFYNNARKITDPEEQLIYYKK